MSFIDNMMDGMVKSLPQEKREEMMVDMMPMMMEGIDMNAFMPRMMEEMLKDVTAEDVIEFLKKTLDEKDKLAELVEKVKQTNLMYKMMFSSHTSKLGFDETIEAITNQARENGWVIPDNRNLQKVWIEEAGVTDMTRLTTIYFCTPKEAYRIVKEDKNEAMAVMMPMGVIVYDKDDGKIGIGTYNMGMMAGMFPGLTGEVLKGAAERLAASLEGIIE